MLSSLVLPKGEDACKRVATIIEDFNRSLYVTVRELIRQFENIDHPGEFVAFRISRYLALLDPKYKDELSTLTDMNKISKLLSDIQKEFDKMLIDCVGWAKPEVITEPITPDRVSEAEKSLSVEGASAEVSLDVKRIWDKVKNTIHSKFERIILASEILKKGKFEKHKGIWKVVDEKGDIVLVSLKEPSCDCEDFKLNNQDKKYCKHLIALYFHVKSDKKEDKVSGKEEKVSDKKLEPKNEKKTEQTKFEDDFEKLLENKIIKEEYL